MSNPFYCGVGNWAVGLAGYTLTACKPDPRFETNAKGEQCIRGKTHNNQPQCYNQAEYERLTDIQDQVVTKWWRWDSYDDRRDTIRKINTHLELHFPGMSAVLLDLAKDYGEHSDIRNAAVAALARLAKDNAAVKSSLFVLAKDDNNGYVRETTIAALAPLAKDDATVKFFLFERAMNGDYYVRCAAIQGLDPLVKNDTTLKSFLFYRAKSEDPNARNAAVSVLAPLAKDDAAVRALFLDRGMNDDNMYVRQTAISTLAPLAKDDAAVRALFLDRGKNDEYGKIRETAIAVLAPLAKDDEAVRALLLDRIWGDEISYIRGDALEVLTPLAPMLDSDSRALLFRAIDERRIEYGAKSKQRYRSTSGFDGVY